MLSFVKDHWDKIVVALIALYGAVLSTHTFRQNKKRELRDQEKADREEKAELTRVLLETSEMKKRVSFLDEWIWDRHIFTRRQDILDALTAIREYWKKNAESLRRFLGDEARTYKALRGLFDVAQQNFDNQPPANGQGEWRGITQDNLLGFKVEQLFYCAEEELRLKRG